LVEIQNITTQHCKQQAGGTRGHRTSSPCSSENLFHLSSIQAFIWLTALSAQVHMHTLACSYPIRYTYTHRPSLD